MATIPLKDITFPGLDNTYTIPEIDNTLSTAGKAADAKKTGDEISELKEDLTATNAEVTDIRVGADGITYSSAGDAVRGQYNQLSSILDLEETELFKFSYVSGTKYDVSPDVQWLWVSNPIDDGTHLNRVKIDTTVADDTEITATFALYNMSGASGRNFNRYTTQTVTGKVINGSAVFNVDLTTVGTSVLGFYSSTTFALTVSATDIYKVTSITDITQTTGTTGSIINYGILGSYYSGTDAIQELQKDVYELQHIASYINVLSQEIHVGEGLDFEEIQDAIESVTGNYATIIVHPKNTPYSRFSLMRSLTANYPWNGLSNVKHISIIGVDKTKCIIQDNSGNYNTPPAEIATNGIIKNLTFIATHSASDGTETTGSYAVHVDNRPADTNGMKLIFENCDFISYQTAAVGLGLYKNQDILFDSCNFKSITDSTWKPNNDYDSAYMCALGAYFMHTTMGYAGGNMFVRFRNCFLYHEGGAYTMRIADADTTQTALLEAINNTLWNGTDNNTGYHTTGNPIMQMPYNHGNNAAQLNA